MCVCVCVWGGDGDGGLEVRVVGDGAEFENIILVLVQGVTRLFLTKIPFFREVIISSFSCEECGLQNAELQPASRIQDKGCVYTVSIQTPQVQSAEVTL